MGAPTPVTLPDYQPVFTYTVQGKATSVPATLLSTYSTAGPLADELSAALGISCSVKNKVPPAGRNAIWKLNDTIGDYLGIDMPGLTAETDPEDAGWLISLKAGRKGTWVRDDEQHGVNFVPDAPPPKPTPTPIDQGPGGIAAIIPTGSQLDAILPRMAAFLTKQGF